MAPRNVNSYCDFGEDGSGSEARALRCFEWVRLAHVGVLKPDPNPLSREATSQVGVSNRCFNTRSRRG